MSNDKKDNTNRKMLGILLGVCSLIALVDFVKFTTGYYNPSKASIGIYMLIAVFGFLSGCLSEFEKGNR